MVRSKTMYARSRVLTLMSIIFGIIGFFSPVHAAYITDCESDFTQIQHAFKGDVQDNSDEATSVRDAAATTNKILAAFNDTNGTKGDLIEYYCDTRFQTHDEVPNIQNQCAINGEMLFDPRQSLFMYGLCVAYDEENKGTANYDYHNWKGIFEETEYTLDMGRTDGQKNKKIKVSVGDYIPDDVSKDLLTHRRELDKKDDPCDPTKGMNNCLMGYPTANILRNIYAGYFDLKKAAIDGFDHGDKQKEMEQAVQDFSRALYNNRGSESGICGDKDKTYLMDADSSANEENSHCGHPQTRSFVYAMVEGAKEDVASVTSLDGLEIFQTSCDDLRGTMLACAMSNNPEGSEGSSDHIFGSEEKSWRNLLANEIFFARMREGYYASVMSYDSRRQGNQESGDLQDKNDRTRFELYAMDLELDMIESATQTMQTLLTQYRTMYHQCVSLTAYQEDIHYFWQRLNKLYTPLHQLQYTTSDAQKP